MTDNQGSTTMRNVPDVALIADNVSVIYHDQGTSANGVFGGTSCAAPLWAGFMALVNQQAADAGKSPVGFLNPAVYQLASESDYASVFHDIVTGDNTWSMSPNLFYAAPGYDLCTGLGTPAGTNLINALVTPDSLALSTNVGFTATGTSGGPFNLTAQTFSLINIGADSLDWSVINSSAWLDVSPASGTLSSGAEIPVTVSLNSVASNLLAGTYTAGIWFTNLTTHVGHRRNFTLHITDPLVLLTTNGFSAYGAVGGPFNPVAQTVNFSNATAATIPWSIVNTSAWLNVSMTSGAIAGYAMQPVPVTLGSAANGLTNGIYTASLIISNELSQVVLRVPFQLLIGQSLVQNGGFETGDFTGWTLDGNGVSDGFIYNAVVSTADFPQAVHAGSYGAFLGDTQIALLSQDLPTVPGQRYLLSFWLDNPVSGSPQEFLINWNTNGVTSQIYDQPNPPVLPWTNFVFTLAATGTNTTLQFGAENPPNFFGLDEISVLPVPRPLFQTASRTNQTFRFTWSALAKATYQIQYKTNLSQAGWINLGGALQATGNVVTTTDNLGTNAQQFYRVIVP